MALKEQLQTISLKWVTLVGLGLAGGYWSTVYDDGTSKQVELQKVQAQTAEIQKTLDENKAFLKDRNKFEEELARLNDQYKIVLEYLPPYFNTQDLLRKLSTEAKIAGVSLVGIKAAPDEKVQAAPTPAVTLPAGSSQAVAAPPAFYEEIKMDVELEGTYAQLMTFLSGVSRLQRLVNIRNVELSIRGIVDGTASISLKAVLISYRVTGV